jgi:hypothetical protein
VLCFDGQKWGKTNVTCFFTINYGRFGKRGGGACSINVWSGKQARIDYGTFAVNDLQTPGKNLWISKNGPTRMGEAILRLLYLTLISDSPRQITRS